MKPRRFDSSDFITLEGADYNMHRAAEALARVEFSRPEKRNDRRLHVQSLFPKVGELSVELVTPEPAILSELL